MRANDIIQLEELRNTPEQIAEEIILARLRKNIKSLAEINNRAVRRNTEKYLKKGIDPDTLIFRAYGAE